MIGLMHGYLLEGSGSNLWTRSIAHALCRDGQDVQLICQEAHPKIYDFIAAAYIYEPNGEVTTLFERDTPYAGRCVMHKPRLGDTLPVYVRDKYEEFPKVVPMIELPDDVIATYLERNATVVERVVRENGLTGLHANHAVLMSVVAERVSAATGVPYTIMPHGSAIEYAVKKDPRFHAFASAAFDKAGAIFCIGDEMRGRVRDVFGNVPGIEDKLTDLNLGVDTAAFDLLDPRGRPAAAASLSDAVKSLPRGRPAGASAGLRKSLAALKSPDEAALFSLFESVRGYPEKSPDADLEAGLTAVDWSNDPLLLFVGRLIAAKGLQNIVAGLPFVLEAHPSARLLAVGHGPMREVIEAQLYAMETGDIGLLRTLAATGRRLEGQKIENDTDANLIALTAWLDRLEADSRLDDWLAACKKHIRPDRVVFTGYLTHKELKHLFPCADVAIFPSVVAEAGPLVFLEALASGCFPLGTYFAGMAASIDNVSGRLPAADADIMKLRPEAEHTIGDIAANTVAAVGLGGKHKDTLRAAVEEHYDWINVARRLAAGIEALATK